MRVCNSPKNIVAIILLIAIISPIFVAQSTGLQLTATNEYNRFVHTHINSAKGNYTLVEKPIFPVMINNSQIQIGQNWTIICPLEAEHNYHAYFYGAWVNMTSAAKTDYNILVYNPDGELDSTHTESAGFLEHLGTQPSVFFTPEQTGNYSFIIKNNFYASKAAQAGTFMIIENLEPDRWYTSRIEGANNYNQPGYLTSWAYEFITNASNAQVFINVPETLDMYEARLYLMNNDKSTTLDTLPLPWEPGLFGNLSGAVGGYNFESDGYRGVAYDSCEYAGHPMFLNYTSKNSGVNLYHLVLIGEEGSGDVDFILKTQFGNITLTPIDSPKRVLPDNTVSISYISSNASLLNAKLSYSTDNWTNAKSLSMVIDNRTCSSVIPGQNAGTNVVYRVEAKDSMQNTMNANGEYSVKQQTTLNIESVNGNITLGGNLTISGVLSPFINNATVTVQFMTTNATDSMFAKVNNDGTFITNYKPTSSGILLASAFLGETQTNWRSDSNQLTLNIKEPPIYVKYSLFIIIGIATASAVSGVVYFLKFRK
jgi:hypothetical protein